MGVDFELLKRLSETPGVPSREERIRTVVVEAMRPLVDEVRVDALGNVVGRKWGRAGAGNAGGDRPRRIMIAAHMDEIGFLVRHVDKNGFLRLQPVGGFDAKTLVAQRVVVHAAGGPLRGVLMPSGGKPPHLMQPGEPPKAPHVEDFFVDVGLEGDEAKAAVEVGEMVTLDRTLERAGDALVGKCLDDRVGVFVMLEALRTIGRHAPGNEVEVVAVATVQEEVGLRGATTAAFHVEPDVGIALDVTLAMDIPGSEEQDHICKLGKGVGIKVMDSSSISDPRLVRHFKELAQREQIPFQMEVLPRGGTDAGAIQRARLGVPAITLSVPTRYVHTPNEMVSETDVEAAVSLLARYLEEAHTFDYAFAAGG